MGALYYSHATGKLHGGSIMDKLKHLSTTEKVIGVGVVGLAAFLIYTHFKSSTPAAAPTMLPSGGMPSGLPSSSPGVSNIVPVAYTGPTRSGGPTGYTVATVTDPLMVRSGPGTNYGVIGQFIKGSTVIATGNLADGSGMTWAEVTTPDGKRGWSSTTYLTPVSAGVAA